VPGWRDLNDGCELREDRPGVLPDRRRTGLYVAYVAMPQAWTTTGPTSPPRRDMGERVATWDVSRAQNDHTASPVRFERDAIHAINPTDEQCTTRDKLTI
jgi:hypothetical protein